MHRLQRFLPIFHGKPSRSLWRSIRHVKQDKTADALFAVAASCQQLEANVIALEQRLAALEANA